MIRSTLDRTVFQITDAALEYFLLKIQAPSPVASIDQTGRVYVYTKEGEKLDTGVVMPLPLPDGQQAIYELLRELGLRCVRP